MAAQSTEDQAFPLYLGYCGEQGKWVPGITRLEYFAAAALHAKTATGLIGYEDHAPEHRAELIRRLVRDCWDIAEEMERERAERFLKGRRR